MNRDEERISLATPSVVAVALSIGLLCISFLIYWPGLSGGWLLDDLNAIANNPSVHLSQLTLDNLQTAIAAFDSGPSSRGLTMMTFGLDYWLWDGDTWGFKFSNLMLHAFNSVLIFWLAAEVFRLATRQALHSRKSLLSAFALAAIWAIHPLQVSTVLYVVQRMEIMAVTFVLAGLLMYIRGRSLQIKGRSGGWLWLSGSAVAALLAFFNKETGILLPAFAFCLEITFFRFFASSKLDRRLLVGLYSIAAVGSAAVFLIQLLPHFLHPNAYSGRNFTLAERLLTQLRVLLLYLSWIVWPDPDRYHFFYDNYKISRGFWQPLATGTSALVLLGLIAAALSLRNRLPFFSLGVLWFFAAHILTSNVFALELVFEHRNYFAIFGILLALAALFGLLPVSRLASRLAVGFMILGFAVLTMVQSATWGDPLNLAMALKNKNPESARAGYHLGHEYLRMSDGSPTSPFFGFATAAFERARHLPDASAMSERVLIELNTRGGLIVPDGLWDDLISKIENGPASGENIKAVRDLLEIYNTGVALDESRLMDAGIAFLNKPRSLPYNYWEFGVFALEGLNDLDTATALFEAGAFLANNPNWNQQVVNAITNRGHPDFAARLAERLQASIHRTDLEP